MSERSHEQMSEVSVAEPQNDTCGKGCRDALEEAGQDRFLTGTRWGGGGLLCTLARFLNVFRAECTLGIL